jgi:virulence factor Mce-like protein
MVTQAPKRSAVAAAVAFALSCLGLMIFTWTQFGGSIPFEPQGYRIHATFKETGLLVPNADVRISGVNVGKVTGVQARGIYSDVTIDIKRQYAPVPVDTRAILRQKTLLGEAYVALSTGTGNGPMFRDGATIPPTQIQDTQQLDQVLGSFDAATQRNLQALLQGTFASLAGRGQDLNDALGNIDPAITELSAVVGVLNEQQGNVQRLINDTGTVLTTVGNRSGDLQSLITAGDQVLSATAARDTQLTQTVNALPAFLTQLRTTLGSLDTTLGLAAPTLKQLRPVAPLLTPALSELIQLSGPAIRLLHQAPSLLHATSKALPSITRFTNAFRPAVDVLLPAAQEVVPMVDFLGSYAGELQASMANFGALLEATGPAATTNNTVGTPSGTAHYARVLPPINNEILFGQSVREPTNRHNAYYSQGEQSLISSPGGLQASDCGNINNAQQVPLLGLAGNVACRVQPGVNWGNGVASGYFPQLVRRPK